MAQILSDAPVARRQAVLETSHSFCWDCAGNVFSPAERSRFLRRIKFMVDQGYAGDAWAERVRIEMIERAAAGIDVTIKLAPTLPPGSSNRPFSMPHGRRAGHRYGDIQWIETGERLTAESFARYGKQGGV